MEFPLEEGYVYGKAPKEPSKPPDINAVFEAVGVPKGKLGELPYPKDWYDGAKERARLRAIELDELYIKKNEVRSEWCRLALGDCDFHIDQVDSRLAEHGPVLGLAELLARAAQERPDDEDRIERLQVRADKAVEDQERLRAALGAARERLVTSSDAIRKREVEDLAAEAERVEQKKAEAARKKKAEKIMARQAALLRGEDVPDLSDSESGEQEEGEAADGEAAEGAPLAEDSLHEGRERGTSPAPAPPATPMAPKHGAIAPPAVTGQGYPPASFTAMRVASSSPHPSPELRGGLARQLPPLHAPAGGAPAATAGASPGRGPPRSPFQSPPRSPFHSP